MTDLISLATRVEKATGADREIDARIMYALRPRMKLLGTVEDYLATDASRKVTAFTASLDAAMTLYVRVPERIPSDPRKATAEALRQRAEEE